MTEHKWYPSGSLNKFDPNTWITYAAVFQVGTCFTHRIKNIPANHIVSRFYLVSQEDANFYNKDSRFDDR